MPIEKAIESRRGLVRKTTGIALAFLALYASELLGGYRVTETKTETTVAKHESWWTSWQTTQHMIGKSVVTQQINCDLVDSLRTQPITIDRTLRLVLPGTSESEEKYVVTASKILSGSYLMDNGTGELPPRTYRDIVAKPSKASLTVLVDADTLAEFRFAKQPHSGSTNPSVVVEVACIDTD